MKNGNDATERATLSEETPVRPLKGGHDRVFLLHMRKAGGTSLRRWLRSVHRERGLEVAVSEGRPLDLGLLSSPGHRTLAVTSLRDPIDRLRSLYLHEGRWVQMDREQRPEAAVPFETFLERHRSPKGRSVTTWKLTSNYYVRTLTGVGTAFDLDEPITSRHLDVAKKTLAAFDIVLLTRSLSSSPVRWYLRRTTGLDARLGHLRRGDEARFDTAVDEIYDPRVLDLARRLNEFDMELYRFAVKLVGDRVQADV